MSRSLHNADIKLLRVFRAIAKCGGFAPAQAQLNASQSTISTQMAQLEARLGLRLCERGHGRFALTEEGQKILEATERLFDAIEDFSGDVAEAKRQIMGEIRIGLIDNLITHPQCPMKDVLAAFSRRAPKVSVNLYVGHAVELEERVMDGRLHLAIGMFPHQLEGLWYTALFEEEHLLYCGATHPLFSTAEHTANVGDLDASNYVSWAQSEPDTGFRGSAQVTEIASSSHMEGVAHFVLSGTAVAFLPSHYAQYWVERNMMRPILEKQTRRRVLFHMVLPQRKRLALPTRVFLEVLEGVGPPEMRSICGTGS